MSGEAGNRSAANPEKRRASKRRRSARSSAVNIYQVARQAKVSIVTVSRVFNDYPHVSRAMREHVLEAARQVGYQPRLVTKRNLIGVLVGKLEDLAAGEQTSRLVLALMRAAASRGYLLEFFPATSAERATQHLADGLIALGLSSVELAGLRSLPSVPRVALNNLGVDESWSAVSVDPADEVQMAVRHLAEQGHTKITLVHSNSRTWQEQQREEGFNAALHACGLDGHHIVLCPYQLPTAELARKIMATHCTGCVCLCHHGGLPVLDGMQNELGIRVPDDLSLITLENKRVSAYLKPRLTTIEQPLDQLAEATLDGLLQSPQTGNQRFVNVLKSKLIKRDSVRPPAS
jgi:DNA-binding LacI/PurR family transcriptional regulator